MTLGRTLEAVPLLAHPLAEEDGAEDKLVKSITGEAVKSIFGHYADVADYEQLIQQFKGNLTFPGGDDLPAEEFASNMQAVPGMIKATENLGQEMKLDVTTPAMIACIGEFLLEGLYVNNRLSKYSSKGKTFFRK